MSRTIREIMSGLFPWDDAVAAAEELEENYVRRWGVLRIQIGLSEPEPALIEVIKVAADSQAEYMGGTIDRDAVEIKQAGGALYYAEWRIRRND